MIRNGAEVFDQIAHFFCDCKGVKHRRDRCDNWKLSDTKPAKSRHVPVAVLKRIRARDGQVCRTPGCRMEGPLQVGHFRPFREAAKRAQAGGSD